MISKKQIWQQARTPSLRTDLKRILTPGDKRVMDQPICPAPVQGLTVLNHVISSIAEQYQAGLLRHLKRTWEVQILAFSLQVSSLAELRMLYVIGLICSFAKHGFWDSTSSASLRSWVLGESGS
jgi:hypothetical protein